MQKPPGATAAFRPMVPRNVLASTVPSGVAQDGDSSTQLLNTERSNTRKNQNPPLETHEHRPPGNSEPSQRLRHTPCDLHRSRGTHAEKAASAARPPEVVRGARRIACETAGTGPTQFYIEIEALVGRDVRRRYRLRLQTSVLITLVGNQSAHGEQTNAEQEKVGRFWCRHR